MDIVHRVGIKASLNDVYRALATREGLAAWWTTGTTGESVTDRVIRFRFPEGGFDMRVLELAPGERVLWEVVDGPAEWIATRVSFDLKHEDGYAIVLFKQQGWREAVEFMFHCSTKWATFLLSLKEYVETGKGRPSPYDLRIDNWD
jgi:uncharacterized protein YndB with AHSA1/START domain